MIAGVADIHPTLWHLFDDKRLSSAAEAFINEAATARRKIAISTISLAEVVYLIEKNRLPQFAHISSFVLLKRGPCGPVTQNSRAIRKRRYPPDCWSQAEHPPHVGAPASS